MTTLDIIIRETAWTGLVNAVEDTVAEAVEGVWRALPDENRSAHEISVVLSSAEDVRTLNAAYRNKDEPTNVLAFSADIPKSVPGVKPLGDIVLSFETVRDEADLQGKVPAHHMTHLVVHGLLHLLGFDHETDDEAEEMEAMERRVLADLGIPDPYRDSTSIVQPGGKSNDT